MSKFTKIVLIDVGTMRSGIAAHLENSKRAVVLLDLKGRETAHEKSQNAIHIMKKSEPALLIEKARLGHIIPGHLTDDFDRIKDADWIIEAMVERIHIKRQLYYQIHNLRNSQSLVSAITATIALSVLTEDRYELMRTDFCITHIFKPSGFMRLLEIGEPPQVDEQKLKSLQDFCQNEFGKGIVNPNDTLGFLGNRIDVYDMQVA